MATAILGEDPLPWENAPVARLRKLGRLRGVVLQCLRRDSRQRPAAGELADALQSIFRGVTSLTTTQTPCCALSEQDATHTSATAPPPGD